MSARTGRTAAALPSAAFTLVEVLVALAILSTILVILVSAFTSAARSREILAGRSAEFRGIRIAMDRIGTDLAGALAAPGRETTAFTCRADQFSGKPAYTLTFTAFTLPDIAGDRPATDIAKIRYFPKVSADGRYIELYREVGDLSLVESSIPTQESRIATRLTEFRVELHDGTTWVKEWPSGGRVAQALPRRVAIVLKDFLGQEYRRVVSVPLAGQEAALLLSGRPPQASP